MTGRKLSLILSLDLGAPMRRALVGIAATVAATEVGWRAWWHLRGRAKHVEKWRRGMIGP